MNELIQKWYYLTDAEFAVCCAAAGIEKLCCFEQVRSTIEISVPRMLTNALFSLMKRGVLKRRDKELCLCRELSDCFRVIQKSQFVVRVVRPRHVAQSGLLYSDSGQFVALETSRQTSSYVGITLYQEHELEDWLADAQLLLQESLPGDLLVEVMDKNIEVSRNLEQFLQRYAWPDPAYADEEDVRMPEEITAFLESRRCADGELCSRIFLIQQTLFDRIIVKTADQTQEQHYQIDALANAVKQALCGEGVTA